MNRKDLWDTYTTTTNSLRLLMSIVQGSLNDSTQENIEKWLEFASSVFTDMGVLFDDVKTYLVIAGLHTGTINLPQAKELTGLSIPELVKMKREFDTTTEEIPTVNLDEIDEIQF